MWQYAPVKLVCGLLINTNKKRKKKEEEEGDNNTIAICDTGSTRVLRGGRKSTLLMQQVWSNRILNHPSLLITS